MRSFGTLLLSLTLYSDLLLAQVFDSGQVLNRFDLDYAVPELHKWYGLRHLPETYTQPWYFTDTRYINQYYTRYVSRQLEGQEFYDTFGRYLGRGWQVYDWTQEQPTARGSAIDKKRQFNAGKLKIYDNFFQKLVIAQERGRQGTYALMIGDEIATYFTPLTLYKPRYNGVRLDGAGDRYAVSLLLSRPSQPDDQEQTNATHLVGGHAQVQGGERATLGFTYVNVHNTQTLADFQEGNPLRGILTTTQNQALEKLWVRVRDDSPRKGEHGARLVGFEIVLVDTNKKEVRGREIGLSPKVEGGVAQDNWLVASDAETILLEYDLSKVEGISSSSLEQVRVELAMADDYRVDWASNLQTDGERFNPEIVFLPARRAPGNVQDNSNSRVVALDYGLPVANELMGMDWNLVDWNGFSSRGEWVLNRRFYRYPNPLRSHHHQSESRAGAGYVHLTYQRYPWMVFFESFSIADGYSTSYWLTDGEGRVRYKNPIPQVYELVEDDDDRDGRPEWQRPFSPIWSRVAWPGDDENQDFLNDNDENANLIPDYDEPFLRFSADRPEFLFGLDMNYNGWIDRFENDDLPDYPYKKDHRGFNAYARANAGPDLSFIAGLQHLRLMAGDGHTSAWYGLTTWTRSLPRGGRLRAMAYGVRVRDNIPDDLIQWFQPESAPGTMREVHDPLPGQDAWKEVLYADMDQRLGAGVRLRHRFKWEQWQQRESREQLAERELRRRAGFLGIIDKAEWSIPLGLGVLSPRWKSEFRQDHPFSTRLQKATSLEETAFLLWNQPLLAERTRIGYFPRYGRQLFSTELQLGVEVSRFWMLQGEREEITGDFNRWTTVAQVVNRTAYQGYQVITRLGTQLSRKYLANHAAQQVSLVFLSVNAGLE